MGRRGALFEAGLLGLAAASFATGLLHTRLHPVPYRPGPREEGTLRVATWNVGQGLAREEGGLRDGDVQHVAEVLVELDPDLVLLQEVTGRMQLRRLLRALGRSSQGSWTGAISPAGESRRVVALAPRGELETFDVAAAGRRALGVVLASGEGAPLVAVALHADAFSAEERNETIGAGAEALFEGPEGVRLLLGDLNLDLDLDKRRDLFTDDEYLDVETYNFVATRLLDAGAGRGPTAEPDRRLDYVFVDPKASSVLAAGPWRDRRAEGMDHDPVVADLRPSR